jgi:hypothetical protein
VGSLAYHYGQTEMENGRYNKDALSLSEDLCIKLSDDKELGKNVNQSDVRETSQTTIFVILCYVW